MFKKIKEFFTGKPATQLEVEVKAEVPYKVEAVVAEVAPVVAEATPVKVAKAKKPAVKKPRAPKAPK
jgi:hypothetical protein